MTTNGSATICLSDAEFEKDPDLDVVFSGGVIHSEDGPLKELHPRLTRPDGTQFPETRDLRTMDDFDLPRLSRGDNMILSHSFVARSRLLTGSVLDDPVLTDS